MYYVVKYSGPFGFIKPWTAVRDSETFSLQFLITSTIEGIEKKLFPELLNTTERVQKISRYRLNYCGLDSQQERTWSKGGFVKEKKKDTQGNVYYLPKTLASLPEAFFYILICTSPSRTMKMHCAPPNNLSAYAGMKIYYCRIVRSKCRLTNLNR